MQDPENRHAYYRSPEWHQKLYEVATPAHWKCLVDFQSLEEAGLDAVCMTLRHNWWYDYEGQSFENCDFLRRQSRANFEEWCASVREGTTHTILKTPQYHGSFIVRLGELFSEDRHLAVTEREGRPVTVGKHARVGDGICILRTAGVPILMRRAEENCSYHSPTYRQIGTVYVHSVMYGEAWTQGDKYLERTYRII
jgi:hypothetical protein